QPLFNARRTEEELTHLAEPLDVPLPLKRRFLDANLPDLYGDGLPLLLELAAGAGVNAVPIGDIRVCDLSDDPSVPGTWAHQPHPGPPQVAGAPVPGRVPSAAAPGGGGGRPATFPYGSAPAVGGGGYDRPASPQKVNPPVQVGGGAPLGPPLTSVAGGGAVE